MINLKFGIRLHLDSLKICLQTILGTDWKQAYACLYCKFQDVLIAGIIESCEHLLLRLTLIYVLCQNKKIMP